MTHTQKPTDKKTIIYICEVIRSLKHVNKQREIIAMFMLNKPEYFLDLVDELGADFYTLIGTRIPVKESTSMQHPVR